MGSSALSADNLKSVYAAASCATSNNDARSVIDVIVIEGRVEAMILKVVFGATYVLMNLAYLGFQRCIFMAMLSLTLMVAAWMIIVVDDSGTVIQQLWVLLCMFVACVLFSAQVALERRKSFLVRVSHDRQHLALRRADSVLNHTLKNTMSDAAGQLEVFLSARGQDLSPAEKHCLGMSAAALWRGIRSCRHRMVYMQLEAGTFVHRPAESDVPAFLHDVTGGVCVQLDTENLRQTKGKFDTVLAGLILDNAISNASRHGHATDPRITVTVSGCPGPTLLFQVTNVANPARRPLRRIDTESLLSGDYRNNYQPSRNWTSDGIGMQHIALAARAASATIHLEQKQGIVTFKAYIPWQPTQMPVVVDPNSTLTETPTIPFPPGVHIACLDDSAMSLFILRAHLDKYPGAPTVTTFGSGGPKDVALFLEHSIRDANIVILDYHLDYPGAETTGVEVLKQLQRSGFQGLVCIRSANSSAEDNERYLSAGFHCPLGKELPLAKAIPILAAAYRDHLDLTGLGCPT
uniref:Response regulatory domain-containing protein n=1 Tax=Eutreptiella gymnastica TaxID=73025 RepID=A0A7S1NJI5_9EUGL|mmetsp:Transcript_45394/g.81263  ORF Transcript_45394/g.81263 Transcript_45394/m.81263 type:complete len:520 (+) Transcript_45394:453-2012(+)